MSITQLAVDLDAISRNLERLRSRAGGLAVIAAVKANAYGHGLVDVARHLEPRVAALGVATVEEGAALRAAGITRPILKFSPTLADELPAALAARLTLTVGSLRGIDELAAAVRAAGQRVAVHLKVDTGMRRVGVEPDDAVEAARRVAADPQLDLEGIFTHYASSDEESGRALTLAQATTFRRVVAAVRDEVGEVRWVHSANSGAILNHDLAGDTAIRPGIALYGSGTLLEGSAPLGLEPVARWTTRVTHVKRVASGETVSYGATWTAPRDTVVATLAVGYGDGWSRLNSNRGRVLVDGVSRPVVGRVCMDQAMVDLGPDGDAEVGAEAVLMGAEGDERITVEEIARLMGTITYEVTCLIAPRVERVFRAG